MQLTVVTLVSFLSVLAAARPKGNLPVPIDSRNLSEIYAAAQKETGVLQVAYGGDEHNQADALSHAFAAQFPNVKVNFTVDLSKYLDGRINNAILQDGLYADVAILQTLQDFDAWKERGLLLNYKPPKFDQLWSSLSDVDGAYIPVVGTHFGPFVFNTSVVSKDDIPTSYGDMLDPKWKGKMVLTYPNDDDAVLYLFTLIIQQYGWEWLEKLAQQDVQWVRGTASPAEIMILNSSRTISFTTFPLQSGLGYVPPVSDRYMSWAQSSAIFQKTRMPETAKLLQAFLVSDAGQDLYLQQGSPSMRKDLAGANGTIWDQTNTDYVQFHEFMNQRDVVESWRFKFEDRLGTAQGLSPLVDSIFVA